MQAKWSKDHIIAPPGFNRWRIPPASIAIHLCIGSVYAWSAYNPALTRIHGVVAPAAGDWTLGQVVAVYSVAIAVLGLSAAVAGKWMEQVGPRTVGIFAACCWGTGYLTGAAGIATHQLWLLIVGYGVIGGCGLGLGYVSPVSTLVKWFPDRRGLATGMAIMGFGGGAAIGVPLKEFLLRTFYRAPEFLGAVDAVELSTSPTGVRLAKVGQVLREAVVVGPGEIRGMIVPGEPGVYLAGTGDVGAVGTFVTLGIGYFLVMLAAAMLYRLPAADWRPAGWTPPDPEAARRRMISQHNVTISSAVRTPQFYLLWIVLCFNVTAGIGILGTAKTMMGEIFGSRLPEIVTAAFASTYAQMTSIANMLGRIGWASASDWIGRRRTYSFFFLSGAALYLTIPWAASGVGTGGAGWLWLFYAATMLIFTMYGGGFATIPAYLADLFGAKYVGGIHGRLLTAWSTAGVIGPMALTTLRESSRRGAISDLASRVDPGEFEIRFGAPLSKLSQLVDQNTVSIPKLLEIAPPGTIDPSTTLYNTTMYLMAGLLIIALFANAMIRPVDARFQEQSPVP